MTRVLTLLVVLAGLAGVVRAQPQIRWRTEPQQAVREAQANMRPLMVYVLAATRDRDDDVEREQRRSLADPRVLQMSQNFVPLRLSRSQHRDILAQFGLPQSANMIMSFVAPNGDQLGTISAAGIANTESLLEKLALVQRAYAGKIYDSEVKPVLENEDAKPADQRRALLLVRELRITDADQLIITMIEERARLNTGIRKLAYEVLAALSTTESVNKLLDWAWDGDAVATKALERCTPVAAEQMMVELQADAEYFPYPVYQIVTKICNVPKPKREKFFEQAKKRLKEEELERVRNIVRQAAQQWRIANGERR